MIAETCNVKIFMVSQNILPKDFSWKLVRWLTRAHSCWWMCAALINKINEKWKNEMSPVTIVLLLIVRLLWLVHSCKNRDLILQLFEMELIVPIFHYGWWLLSLQIILQIINFFFCKNSENLFFFLKQTKHYNYSETKITHSQLFCPTESK